VEFVIQEHRAKRAGLHHDFRLEVGDMLESWVIPKGVPLTSSNKRLAIKTFDHPIDYKGFEGKIEEGYGKGIVAIFDSGEYIPIDIRDDFMLVQLRGGKVTGNYCLKLWEGDKWLIWKR